MQFDAVVMFGVIYDNEVHFSIRSDMVCIPCLPTNNSPTGSNPAATADDTTPSGSMPDNGLSDAAPDPIPEESSVAHYLSEENHCCISGSLCPQPSDSPRGGTTIDPPAMV